MSIVVHVGMHAWYNGRMDEALERYMTIKSPAQIEKMRAAGRLAAEALSYTVKAVKAGISTGELDRLALDFILSRGARAASLGYRGFPKAICTSVNDVVCHGIPSDREVLKDGDIINLDIAVILDGWHGDNSVTVPVGTCSPQAMKLMEASAGCLERAIAHVKPGIRTRELGSIIEDHVTKLGFSTVREFVGHGIGQGYHEPPNILHYSNKEACVRLRSGMTVTIEPMINAGMPDVTIDQADGWTVRTRDKSLSAQFEHTILVTETGYEVLTHP